MTETPKQAAWRIVNSVLADVHRNHPDEAVRSWALDMWQARVSAAYEERIEVWRRFGESMATAYVRLGEFARAFTEGVRGVLEVVEDHDDDAMLAAGRTDNYGSWG